MPAACPSPTRVARSGHLLIPQSPWRSTRRPSTCRVRELLRRRPRERRPTRDLGADDNVGEGFPAMASDAIEASPSLSGAPPSTLATFLGLSGAPLTPHHYTIIISNDLHDRNPKWPTSDRNTGRLRNRWPASSGSAPEPLLGTHSPRRGAALYGILGQMAAAKTPKFRARRQLSSPLGMRSSEAC